MEWWVERREPQLGNNGMAAGKDISDLKDLRLR